jgi:hypothetical protein
MHKSATKCNETVGNWCKNKHGASKIIDTLETDHWTKRKPNIQKFTEASREPKRRRKGARRRPHHQGARPRAWLRRPVVSPTWSTSDAAPLPIKTPRREKPKYPITFPETHRDPPPSSTRDREGPEALPGTMPERGITTGGLLHFHACLRCDE